MGSTLGWALMIVGTIFNIIWIIMFFVSIDSLKRDNLAPEWILSSLGIYTITYYLIFGFKCDHDKIIKSNETNELS
jgi:hypothetical protein